MVNFNGGYLLANAVLSVLDEPEVGKVVVVDNASRDASIEVLRAFCAAESRLEIIELNENTGFAAACNRGAEAVTSEYILYLNPDCMVPAGTLAPLLELMARHADVGMLGCLVRNADGSEQIGCRRKVPTPRRTLVRVLFLDRLLGNSGRMESFNLADQALPDEPIDIEAISGSFMLVRAEALRKVGGMDTDYFMHGEDLDWCMRFRREGWRILFVPDVSVIHYKGVCSGSRPLRVLWYKHVSMWLFYSKHFRATRPMWLSLAVLAAIVARYSLLLPIETLGSFRRGQAGGVGPRVRYARLIREVHARRRRRLESGAAQLAGFRGKPVLVTGATGFVGRHLVDALLALGAKVSILVRETSVQPESWRGKLSVHTADLGDRDKLSAACAGKDAIFHLGAQVERREVEHEQQRDLQDRITYQGTKTLVDIALEQHIGRLVFFSSVKVMGEGDRHEQDESEAPAPLSNYGKAKLRAEAYVLERCAASDTRATVLRLPMIYGRGAKGNFVRMLHAMRRGWFPALPKIDNRRSMVHVDDVVYAALLACGEGGAGECYIVTDGRAYSSDYMVTLGFDALGMARPVWRMPRLGLRVLARSMDLLGGLLGREPLFRTETLDKLLGSAVYSSAKIRRELNFENLDVLETGLPEIVCDELS